MARHFKSAATAPRHFKAGVLDHLTPAAANMLTGAAAWDPHGAAGTYHAPEVSEVQKGAVVGTTTGTLVGIVDSAGALHLYGCCTSGQAWAATGVIYGTGDYATEASRNYATAGATEILTSYAVTLLGVTTNGSATAEAHAANEVLKSAGGNYNDDNLSNANVRPVTYGLGATGDLSGLLATDAAYVSLEQTRNNDNGTVAADIVTGKSVKVRNTTITGAATLESHTANQVISTAGGNWDVSNLSVGNVRPVAFGLSQTGTLANLAATDAAYVSLEASRNSKTAGAAQILTGYSVTIASVTTNGSLPVSGSATVQFIGVKAA
jgi:hypothetical protein